MDFVIKLLKLKDPISAEVFDLIIVIYDKLSKYTLIILVKEIYKVEQIAFILLDRLIRDYRIPKSITSNRDK